MPANPALTQALINITQNAIKFSEPGNKVEITAGKSAGSMVTISIRDYGVGMKTEEARLAVVPFYQANDTRTRKHSGVGLGLPIAKRLIELHKGALSIDTDLDVGTNVNITIPTYSSLESEASFI